MKKKYYSPELEIEKIILSEIMSGIAVSDPEDNESSGSDNDDDDIGG